MPWVITVKRIPLVGDDVRAVCIWPVIVVEEEVAGDAGVMAHERFHWRDQLRWLVLPWHIGYQFCARVLGQGTGRDNWFERGAYAAQDAARRAAHEESDR